jgi:pimeloyl-ACP methyl ester carboxylesterase
VAALLVRGRGATLGGAAVVVAAGAAVLTVGAGWERWRRRRDAALPVPGREVRVAGRRVWVQESGPWHTGRPPVVLLTGAGDQTASWVLVRERLSESFRVIGYDRVGMGRTEDRPGERSLGGYVEELSGVLAAVQITGPVLLVGHSFGGLIALAYAAANPGRVAGLVLVDAAAPALARSPVVRTALAVNVAVARALRALSPLGVTRALFAAHAMPLYPERHLLRAAASPDEYRRWAAALCAGFAGNAAREIAAVLPAAAEFPEPVARVGGPVTVIHGRLLGATWERLQQEVAGQYPGNARIFTDDRFHNIHLSHPDLIIGAVHDQLGTPASG